MPGERTKNGTAHMVSLSTPARDLLRALLPEDANDAKRALNDRCATGSLVLPGEVGTPFAGWSKAKRALDKAIIDARAKAAAGRPALPIPWSVHDLRRTVATGLQRLGVRLEVTEAVLNHISGSRGGIAGVYQRHDWAAREARGARRMGGSCCLDCERSDCRRQRGDAGTRGLIAVKPDPEAPPSVVGSLPAVIEVSDLPLLNEALAFLLQELVKATELYQSDANAGREGVIHSVETAVKFFSMFAPVISSSLYAPLVGLFDALVILDDGRVLPVLKPAEKTGATPASAARASLIGAAVFTAKRLTETGMQAPAAHEAVARKLEIGELRQHAASRKSDNCTNYSRMVRGGQRGRWAAWRGRASL